MQFNDVEMLKKGKGKGKRKGKGFPSIPFFTPSLKHLREEKSTNL